MPSFLHKFYRNGVLTSTFYSLLIRFSGFAITILTTVLLTNLLGSEQYGRYVYIFSLANLVVLFVVFGMDTLLVRQCVIYVLNRQSALFHGVLVTTFCFALGTCSLMLAVYSLLPNLVETWFPAQFRDVLSYLFILLPVLATIRLLEGLNRGLHAPLLAQLPDQIIRRFLFFTLTGIFILLPNHSVSASTMLGAQAVAGLLCVGAGVYFSRMQWPVLRGEREFEWEVSRWMKSSFHLAGTTILQTVVAQFPLLFLGYFALSDSVAQYSVAERTAAFLNLFFIASNFAIAGRIAANNNSQRVDEQQEVATKAARFAFSLALPFALILLVFAEPILAIYGDEYRDSASMLRLFVLGYLIHIAAGPAALFLQMTHQEKYTLQVSTIMFLVSLALSFLLTKHFAQFGAALAFVLSFVSYKLIIVMIVRQKLHIDTSIIGFRCQL